MKKFDITIYFVIFMITLELLFNYFCFGTLNISNIIYIFVFSIPAAIIISLMCNLFKKNLVNKVIYFILISLVTIIFVSQFVYFKVYSAFFSLDSIMMANQAVEARSEVFSTIIHNLLNIVVLLIPLIVGIIFSRKFSFERNNKFCISGLILIACFTQLAITEFIKTTNVDNYSTIFNLYYENTLSTLTTKNFGLLTNMRLNLMRSDDISIDSEDFSSSFNSEVIDLNNRYSLEYNELDINFQELIMNEKDSTIKYLHQYFGSQEKTIKNEYTGIFEGKNVIYILAESFDPIAIDKELTPTLYKMSTTGFVFNNYYTPLYAGSTGDGEYIAEWGLLPNNNVSRNLMASSNNYSPYLFLNVFKDYKIGVYHNYIHNFYDRNIYFSRLGYQNVKFCNNGLSLFCINLHGSDHDLLLETVPEFIKEDKFFTYYITVGGHGSYEYKTNYIVQKNWHLVNDLPYTNNVKGYLASAIDLDKALEYLLEELEKNNKLDDTVIVITPDHYPYYLKEKDFASITTAEKKTNKFETYKSSLIIWNNELAKKEPIIIDKVVSNLDVLPTLLNLIGYNYDSRLLMGIDALSNKEGIVILSDGSWVTDYGIYESLNTTFIPRDNVVVPSNYVNSINNIVDTKYKVSRLVQETNYYKKLFK